MAVAARRLHGQRWRRAPIDSRLGGLCSG
jgi:hypothetical protein